MLKCRAATHPTGKTITNNRIIYSKCKKIEKYKRQEILANTWKDNLGLVHSEHCTSHIIQMGQPSNHAVSMRQGDTGRHWNTQKWVPIEKISPYMYRAAIASEDNYFLGHRGFDVIAINTALKSAKAADGTVVAAQSHNRLPKTSSAGQEVPGYAKALKPISHS